MSLVIPTTYEQILIVLVGDTSYYPTETELEELRDWVNDHQDTWPNCFPDLNNIMNYPLELLILPELNPEHEYVFVLESDYEATKSDIDNWTQILNPTKKEGKFTVFVYSEFFKCMKRIRKNLLPFI
jgi:hypothetical protein